MLYCEADWVSWSFSTAYWSWACSENETITLIQVQLAVTLIEVQLAVTLIEVQLVVTLIGVQLAGH